MPSASLFNMEGSTLQVLFEGEPYYLYSTDSERGTIHQVASGIQPQPGNPRGFIATVGLNISNPMYRAFLSMGYGDAEMDSLKAEYKIYMHMAHLQGTVIPRCYGYFVGDKPTRVGQKTQRVGCLVLEYCCEDRVRALTEEEFNRQIMSHMCKIHAAGVEHRNINYQFPRHIVKQGLSPRIVNFSKARLHKCVGAIPAASNGQLMGMGATCPELVQLELNYGLRSGTMIVPPQPILEPYVNGR
ncbi:hypothetical protein BDN70DRAFT_956405 [Pholiota conissans]|uniref:Protein kinase domain-containing protein n=1 Tax=Pholiota conissans TaxID=109636 RepID=A0A9P5YVJ1_9AGAR|nr:hypothetical protein BDN70DRAFT_956405 [Pholiota conissans]